MWYISPIDEMKPDRNMRHTVAALKALADANRLRILCALRKGELCVCQLIALLKLAPSTVSKHLSVLRAAGWVQSRKNGRWVHYRLTSHFRTPQAAKMLKLQFEELDQTGRLMNDLKHLDAICKENMETLCKRLFCKATRSD